MRSVIFGVFCIIAGIVALPFVRDAVQWLGGNHYPGTAQQAGASALLLTGKEIALELTFFHNEHGRWPTSLVEAIAEGPLTAAQVHSYPKLDDLPDRREIPKTGEFEDWLYILPSEGSPDLPMVVAPRPYTSSMGKRLTKPRRIIVAQDTVATSVEEEKIGPVLFLLRQK